MTSLSDYWNTNYMDSQNSLQPPAPTPEETMQSPQVTRNHSYAFLGNKKILIPLVIVLLLGIIGGSSYILGRQSSKTTIPENTTTRMLPTISPTDNTIQTIVSPAVSPTVIPSDCDTDFTFYENEYFSLCHPNDMTLSQFRTFDMENGIASGLAEFKNDTEILQVNSFFQGGWGGSPCMSTVTTTVSGYKADKIIWKEELPSGTCGVGYIAYATLIDDGIGTYYLALNQNPSGIKHFLNIIRYTTIENSLKIKKKS